MTQISLHDQNAIEVACAAPMLSQVEAWCAVNSGSYNVAGLQIMSGLFADAFSDLPGTLYMVEPDPVEWIDSAGRVQPVDHGKHLQLSVRPEAPVQLLFTGHMDTVFPIDHAFQSLIWREPGILNGPGVADMKGGIAVMLAALKAIETHPLGKSIGYDVILNSDEETGSAASAGLLARAAQGKIAALTYEPALPDGTLAGARSGSGNFSLIVTGRSAHAGRNPEEGRNALVAAADLAIRLKQAVSPGLKVNPARIDGGGLNNVVPDHAVLRVNFRPASSSDEDAAKALLNRVIAAVAKEHDVCIDMHGSFGRPPKIVDEGAEALFNLIKKAGAQLDLPIAWRATGGVCDGNNIAACGVPVVDTMGPRGGDIHSSDEYLIVDSLPERAALSTLSILRIAQGRLQ